MAGSTSKTVLLMLFLVYVEGTSAQANSTVGGSTMAATTGVTQLMSSDMRSTASPSAADTTTGMRSTTISSTVQSDTTTDTTAAMTTVAMTTVAMTTDAMATTTGVVIKANTTASVVLDPEELANQKIGNIMALSLAIPLNTFTAITLAVFIVGKRRKRLSVSKGDDQLKLEAADSKAGGGVDNGGYAVQEEKNSKAYMTSSVGNGDHLGMESTKL
ncbi:hypothetical protein Bbelb_215710 [Branchiostoma belcheri]|nr:hypothetical protein Bbelb_215710 [Branchiostoma belcheri]